MDGGGGGAVAESNRAETEPSFRPPAGGTRSAIFFLREKKHQGILQFSFPHFSPSLRLVIFRSKRMAKIVAYEGSNMIFYFTLLRRRRPASLDINRQLQLLCW